MPAQLASVECENAPYPSFETAIERLSAFAHSQNIIAEPVFVSAENVRLIENVMNVRLPKEGSSFAQASAVYYAAIRRRLGVCISAVCSLPRRRYAVYVYGPESADEAVRLMYPDALKLSFPVELRNGVLCGRIRWFLLSTANRFSSIVQRSDELLK